MFVLNKLLLVIAGTLMAMSLTPGQSTAQLQVLDLEAACTALEFDEESCFAARGCKSSSFAGTGGLNEGGTLYSATGSWVDGCGGRHQDDSVAGEWNTFNEFHVNELPGGGARAAHCASSSSHRGDFGGVSPGWTDDGEAIVSFSCDNDNGYTYFVGYLGGSDSDQGTDGP